MAREINRDYIPTPELIKDGLKIAPIPVLSDDWIGLRRLLTDLRKVATDPNGTITGRRFRTAVEPDQRIEIDTPNGIRIYNSDNELTAQFNGDELTILGGTIIGATFKTANSPNERIEIDSVNGIRVYNSSNVLVGQIDESAIFFSHVTTDDIESNAATVLTIDGRGGIAFNQNGTSTASLTTTGLLMNSLRIAFNTFTSADAAIFSSGTTILIGKADGSGFSDLEARNLIATSHLTAEGVTSTGATGTGKLVFDNTPTLIAPLLGTPTSGTLTNCTIPVGGVSGLGSGVATFLATPSSTNLAAAVTGETGSGALVFATSPTLVAPVIGSATGTDLALSGTLSLNPMGIAIFGNPATSGARIENTAADTLTVENHNNSGLGNLVCGTITPSLLNYFFGGITGSFNPATATSVTFSDGILMAFS